MKTRFDKFAKLIRSVTVAPLLALLCFSILHFTGVSGFESTRDYIASLVFLVIMPLSSYLIHYFLPALRRTGREGQRNLAIAMCVAGYIFCMVYGLVAHVHFNLLLVYICYLLSGIGIVLFNKVFGVKASGHSCGVAGPIAYMTYFVGPWALLGCLLLVLVFLSSVKMKRHTVPQLITGSLISLFAFLLTVPILRLAYAG